MSAVRALLQSMPPLFGPDRDLDEHMRDLEVTERPKGQLDTLLLASVEESLLLPIEQPASATATRTTSHLLHAMGDTAAEESRRKLTFAFAVSVEEASPKAAASAKPAPSLEASAAQEPTPLVQATAKAASSPAVETPAAIEQAPQVESRQPGATASTELTLGTAPLDVVEGQLISHRIELASVDQKLASIDGDIDQTKSRVAEVNQALKLRMAQRACLLTLRKAHAQFISRCAKTA